MPKEDEENQVLKRLDELENQLNKKIENIESSLKKIEKSSNLTTEDQLFFGIVFTLFILFLQFPEFDVCSIFENFGVTVDPSKGFLTMKMVLISLLLFSSVTRYLTALIDDDERRNKYRVASVAFLLSCIYFIVMDLTIRGLTAVLKDVNIFLILLSPIALTLISILIGVFVEKKWYREYGGGSAIGSFIFGFLGLTILIAYYLAMVVSLFIPISDLIILFILVSSVVLTYLAIQINDYLRKRLKKKTEKSIFKKPK